ncbi:endonuclease III [candidate division WOR-3 bacterium]|nr:endonuclease III [candidate division WOR-3 bacterium]
MKIETKVCKIYEILSRLYPRAKCHLLYSEPHQLLISGILSAQTLDSRVNSVTPKLFKEYPTLKSISQADESYLRTLLKPVGMFNIKSKRIIEAAAFIENEYFGCIPETIEELVRIPGVGRKTANLFIGEYLGKPAIIVDTHFKRVTARLCLVEEGMTPDEIEFEVMKILPQKIRTTFSFSVGDHGREVCKARKPLCSICCITKYCCSYPDGIPR